MGKIGFDGSISSHGSVALNDCDREPIHRPATIQAHGALAVFSTDGTLLQRSDNLFDFLGVSEETSPQSVFEMLVVDGSRETLVSINDASYRVWWHGMDSVRIAEIERDTGVNASTVLSKVAGATDTLAVARSQQDVYEAAVAVIQDLTGFDRVMAYMFGPEGHGCVRAEALSASMDSMLGLHFPATDIPRQARHLYTLQLSRQIRDVFQQPVAVSPPNNPFTQRPLDMSLCRLRAVSPVHVQYLRNMGVRSSYSISLIEQGKLIGLIACHHSVAKDLPFDIQIACELIGRTVSEHLARRAIIRRRHRRNQQLSAQVAMLSELGDTRSLSAENGPWDVVASFVDCDALLVRYDGINRAIGSVDGASPSLWQAAANVAGRCNGVPSSCRSLSEVVDTAPAGGVLAIPIGSHGWLAWYRRELATTVRWGGRPEAEAGKTLTPRASFEEWTETAGQQCARWSESDMEMADLLLRGLAARFDQPSTDGDTFERAMKQLREYTIHLERGNQALQNANFDLKQFAHAASHDLRAPLRTIRSFLPLIEDELKSELTEPANQWLGYVKGAADTLYRLQEGLWAFSRVDLQNSQTTIDMNQLVEQVCASLAADLANASVTVAPLPPTRGVHTQVETLLRNLVENACKYRSKDRKLAVSIGVRDSPDGPVYRVTDNGIGFPPETADRVFDLFTRLHTDRADGDGLGLALCRRIVNHHGGMIRALPELGEGTTFEFTLPMED